jgi:tetratricopeptide (TPR) repeat protein
MPCTWPPTPSLFAGDHAAATSAIDRALILNPNCAHAWRSSGYVLVRQCRPDPAIDAFYRAMRLSPLDPLGFLFTAGIAIAHLIAGRYEEAIEWADRSLREFPRYAPSTRYMVIALAHLGRIEEAREWLARELELHPGLTIAGVKATYEAAFPPEKVNLFAEGYRKVGLPEG